jgi:hypothetical protein
MENLWKGSKNIEKFNWIWYEVAHKTWGKKNTRKCWWWHLGGQFVNVSPMTPTHIRTQTYLDGVVVLH